MTGAEQQYGAFSTHPVTAHPDEHSGGSPAHLVPVVTVEEPNPPSAVQDPPNIEVSPDSDVSGHEDICSRRKTSMFLYGAFVEYVRKLYRDGLFLVGTPDVRWGRTTQADGVWIDAEYNWKPENPEFLPAIYVKLGELQYSFRTGSQDRFVGVNIRNGIYESERTGAGTVTFVHVSRTSGEAIALCDNTRYRMNEYSRPIQEDLCLNKFHEASANPLAPAQKVSSEAYQSSSTFTFEFLERWGIKMESPILRSVDVLQESRRYGIVKTGATDLLSAGRESAPELKRY